jgi:alginate O-acetyltransferase complex protein AlgI
MLFNSYAFLFLFLPAILIGTIAIERGLGRRAALHFLTLASLFFYWRLAGQAALALLILSILGNLLFARAIAAKRHTGTLVARILVIAGVGLNLALLGYFKYANFFLEAVGQAAGQAFAPLDVLLPIGISFFTFMQIAYLVDVYGGEAEVYGLGDYALFVSFFPYVTAGPIVHHSEIIPQYRAAAPASFIERLLPGLTLFSLGLFKKVVFADSLGAYADAVFNGAALGAVPSLPDAWTGAITYTLQLYFDFSGYSDMAIGLGAMLGIRLPINFNSPYKATDIADFWRRWHMTLTRFFTSYIYMPLAVRSTRRHGIGAADAPALAYMRTVAIPVLVTFFLAGLWHGAGWNFVVFGLVHGTALCIFRGWRMGGLPLLPRPLASAATMLVVIAGMVLFRADSLGTALTILRSMVAGGGGFADYAALAWMVGLGAVALLAPNTQELMHRFPVSSDDIFVAGSGRWRLEWRDNAAGIVAAALTFCIAVLSITRASQFLYYQF